MNRLQDEPSLYLRQHADNPVDWWPWNDEALAAARDQGKPILLSIGYSACHWCHVMAHESFEDPGIAALMNEHFINIKVDREQRPDLDKIYQTAHQLMTQRPGGWPLTMFLTPDDRLPFFGGTYFPPSSRQGLPGFDEVLAKVAEFHTASPAEAARQGGAVREVFEKLEPELAQSGALDDASIAGLRQSSDAHFDADNGGFGRAPKFPQVATLARLLNHWRDTASDTEPDLQALFMSALSQTRMARGGLFDQVGGGYFRYCVDATWTIPHFEKMLYDNGQLLALNAATFQATGDALFGAAARATADWMLRDMRHTEGGFFATIDADSDDGEGAYYTFTPDELRDALSTDHAALALRAFGLDRNPNFEGRWHLQLVATASELAEETGAPEAALDADLARIRESLATARSTRPAPGRDEKILTAWNALAMRGLVIAARAFEDDSLTAAAADCAAFLHTHCRDGDRLITGWQDGTPLGAGFLDDYALLADALLELSQNHWDARWFNWCVQLADQLLALFEDPERGGFFFTTHDHEALMYRQKPIGDDALPSGNAVAARVLLRLGHLLGEPRYLEAAERALRFALPALREYPQAHVTFIETLAEYLAPVETIVIRGDAALANQWRASVQKLYAPSRVTLAIPGDAQDLPQGLDAHRAPAAGALAYVCRGQRCLAAIDNWRALASEIRER
ncbi:MAG: thioredoxin domain-containing protein [Pseudomonadota bacterium]